MTERFGPYAIEQELGRGGMGIVYRARHDVLGPRALKVLLPEVSRDESLVERFINEARAAAAIDHPSIVRVYEVGQVDGRAYIAMELLDGESLGARLRSHGAFTLDTSIDLARRCALALAAAHAAGIVHRDLKPDNVFLVEDRVKLLDFGVAKLLHDGALATARTLTGAILGTPHYMSPEQCEGAREVDHRSDLYSLGVMLFQMISGRLPFQSNGIGGLIGMHLHVAPPDLRELCPYAPVELAAIVARLLAKSPADRYQSADDVANALAVVRISRRVAIPAPQRVVLANAPTVVTQAPLVPESKRPSSWRAVAAVAAWSAIALSIMLVDRSADIAEAEAAAIAAAAPEPIATPVVVATTVTAPGEAPDPDDAKRTARALDAFAKLEAAGEHEYSRAKLAYDEVHANTDPSDDLRIRAERFWQIRTRQRIHRMVKHGRCTEAAHAIDDLAYEDITVRDQVADCQRLANAADSRPKPDAKRTEQTQARMTTAQYIEKVRESLDRSIEPRSMLGMCRQLIALAPERVPFSLCVSIACEYGRYDVNGFIAKAPINQQNQLRRSCQLQKRL